MQKEQKTTKQAKVWYVNEELYKENQDLRQNLQGEIIDDLQVLENLGVYYRKFDGSEESEELATFMKEKGYNQKDLVKLGKGITPDYEGFLQKLKTEHLHIGEEIRYMIEGNAFFDVRSLDDKWIRISVDKGDFISLPEGIYHRFSLDSTDYALVMRVYKDNVQWTQFTRPCDNHESRKSYVEKYHKKE